MKKLRITEEQYNKLMSIDEAWIDNDPKEDKKEDEVLEESEEECEEPEKEDLYENIERTFGNLEVRNLIKEGDEIRGEVKSSYGVWNKMKWDDKGTAKGFDNLFKRLTYKINL